MASPDQNSVDLSISTFGGRCTQFDAQTLPVGASPFNTDVKFSGINPLGVGMVAGVATRDGLGSGFYSAPFTSNPTVNYLKTFVDAAEVIHLLSLDGLGVVYDESPCPAVPTPGFPPAIGSVVAASIAQSDTLFGREWMAFSSTAHPGFGIDIPRQWDGTHFDRVSQSGPGAAPSAVDYAPQATLANSPGGIAPAPGKVIANSPNGLIETGNVVTVLPQDGAGFASVQLGDAISISGAGVAGYNGNFTITGFGPLLSPGVYQSIQYTLPTTGLAASGGGAINFALTLVVTTAANPFVVGQQVVFAGVGVAGYNTTAIIRGVNSPTLFQVYNSAFLGLAASGGGTVTLVGNISAGLHNVSVSFITRQNYITKPAPFSQYIAGGAKQALLTKIPTGPANIIGRVLIFTPVITAPATSGPFFYFQNPVTNPATGLFPSMVINDNTTTSYVVDFLDSTLQLGTAATTLFNLLVLGECAKVLCYSNRTFWAGERNKLPNLLNMDFEGGWNLGGGTGGSDVPLGWISDPTNGKGGSRGTGWYLDGFKMTGDGAASIVGMITQGAFQDFLGVNILAINTAYSVRVRTTQGLNNTNVGSLVIEIFSPSAGSLGKFIKPVTGISGIAIQEYIGALMTAQTTIPSDALLRAYFSGTPIMGGFVSIDCIEIFPTSLPYNTNVIRVSYANQPEAIDGTTGFMVLGAAQGQSVRTMFTLLDNKVYIHTERGFFNTQDDGQNEPSLWTINTISSTVGTGSVRGVGIGESWSVTASHDGAYIFWGGEPVKISQEIQPDWDNINWNYDQLIYTVVDTSRKRIIIGAPVGSSTVPNVEFVCDYSQLANAEGTAAAEDIASHPQAYYSVYNPTKVVAPGKARKWTLWNISANSCALTIRSDGSFHLLRGNNSGNGKIYDQLPGQLNDDGVAINSQYQTAYLPQSEEEQMLQLGTHRKLFKYLTHYSFGAGAQTWTIYGPQNQRPKNLSTVTLAALSPWDTEMNVNWVGERASFLFGTNGLTSWFELTKFSITVQREIMTPVRGRN